MSAAVVITPWAPSHAIELSSRQWIKRVLPVGDVAYQGKILHFTRDYLRGLAEAFKNRAYDQVPFQIADSSNAHTNDPTRFRGEVLDMEVRHDGLYAMVRPTEAGEELLKTNPNLGISARIVEGYERSDNKFFPAAIQHVLGTLDPRIPALGPWEPVAEMSNDGPVPVLDLSNCWFEGQRFTVDLAAENQQLADAINEAETDEELAEIFGMSLEEFQAINGSDDGDVKEWLEPFTEEELAELDALAADPELGESVAALQAASLSNTYDYPGGEQELAGDFSQTDFSQIDLAVQMDQARLQAEQIQGRRYWAEEAARNRQGKVSTEVRLANAMERISQGTYVPNRATAFANESQREILLSSLRDSQDVPELAGDDADALATAAGACGILDDFGRCGEPQHDSRCSAVYSPDHLASDEGRRLLAEVSVTPIGDGRQMLPGDWLEAATGVRLSHEDEGPFEVQRAERAGYVFQRRPVYGDPQEGGGTPLDDAATQLRVSQLRDAMGITAPERASRVARQQAVTDRRAALKLQTPMQRAGLDTSDRETRAERREQVSQRSMVPLEIDGVLAGYTKSAV